MLMKFTLTFFTGDRTWALNSERETDQDDFINWMSYHQAFWRKSALIQKPLARIPKDFFMVKLKEQ